MRRSQDVAITLAILDCPTGFLCLYPNWNQCPFGSGFAVFFLAINTAPAPTYILACHIPKPWVSVKPLPK